MLALRYLPFTTLADEDMGEATPEHVTGGFLRDLGVPPRAAPTALEDRAALFRSILAGRRVLVVLDNAAAVAQVRLLPPGEPGCLVIVTSRSRLSGLVAREGARRLQLDLLLALRRRHLGDAAAHIEQAASIAIEPDDQRWAALLRGNLAEALCERDDLSAATGLLRDVLATFSELGDRLTEGNALRLVVWAHRAAGRLDHARTAIDDAPRIAVAHDNQLWEGQWLAELARTELARGQTAEALVSSQRAAVIQRRLGDRSREAIAIDLTGPAYQQLERHGEAVKFTGGQQAFTETSATVGSWLTRSPTLPMPRPFG